MSAPVSLHISKWAIEGFTTHNRYAIMPYIGIMLNTVDAVFYMDIFSFHSVFFTVKPLPLGTG